MIGANTDRERRALQFALWIGTLVLVLKVAAYALTRSTALLSDAVESVVHLVAALFAFISWKVAQQPADDDHRYGHAKISFFSAGFEGGVIWLSALLIVYVAWDAWRHDHALDSIEAGIWLTSLLLVINAALGVYLVWCGKQTRSLIVSSHGKHVLTDCITSLGALLALILVKTTHWREWDQIIALAMSVNLMWMGSMLMRKAFSGLMDENDPEREKELVVTLDRLCKEEGVTYHALRHRDVGNAIFIEAHLVFPDATTLLEAHEAATRIERAVEKDLPPGSNLLTHLECESDHAENR